MQFFSRDLTFLAILLSVDAVLSAGGGIRKAEGYFRSLEYYLIWHRLYKCAHIPTRAGWFAWITDCVCKCSRAWSPSADASKRPRSGEIAFEAHSHPEYSEGNCFSTRRKCFWRKTMPVPRGAA